MVHIYHTYNRFCTMSGFQVFSVNNQLPLYVQCVLIHSTLTLFPSYTYRVPFPIHVTWMVCFWLVFITTQSDSGFPELFSAVLHCRGHGRQSLALSSRRELGTGGGRGLCSIDRCLTGEAGSLTWGGWRRGCIDLRGLRSRTCHSYSIKMKNTWNHKCYVILKDLEKKK